LLGNQEIKKYVIYLTIVVQFSRERKEFSFFIFLQVRHIELYYQSTAAYLKIQK